MTHFRGGKKHTSLDVRRTLALHLRSASGFESSGSGRCRHSYAEDLVMQYSGKETQGRKRSFSGHQAWQAAPEFLSCAEFILPIHLDQLTVCSSGHRPRSVERHGLFRRRRRSQRSRGFDVFRTLCMDDDLFFMPSPWLKPGAWAARLAHTSELKRVFSSCRRCRRLETKTGTGEICPAGIPCFIFFLFSFLAMRQHQLHQQIPWTSSSSSSSPHRDQAVTGSRKNNKKKKHTHKCNLFEGGRGGLKCDRKSHSHKADRPKAASKISWANTAR